MEKRLKYSLWFFVLLLMAGPLIQSKLKLFQKSNLGGTKENVEWVPFEKRTWFEGEYQKRKANYLKQTLGFRNSLIRINNQIAYSLFDYGTANGVIVGKEEFLFEEGYINAYLGHDYIGRDSLKVKMVQIEKVADTLKKLGVELVLILAPGKAFFYPEYIPDSYLAKDRDTSNYEVLVQLLEKSDINYLDCNQWFQAMKDTASHVLYPKTGIHWSKYAEVLVGDSLSRYLSQLMSHPLPKMEINAYRKSKVPSSTDDDIERGMNIFTEISDLEMTYVNYEFYSDTDSYKPRTISIGDSYYWGIFGDGISEGLFENNQFWYYNEEVYWQDGTVEIKDEIDEIDRVASADLICIINTTNQLSNFGFDFFEDLYLAYFEPTVYEKEIDLKRVYLLMKKNKDWYRRLEKKAENSKRPLDSIMLEDARYFIQDQRRIKAAARRLEETP